ncbi:MAG: alanine/ornithine racemase family PLP-dependent enzyme [Thermotogota bacterium]
MYPKLTIDIEKIKSNAKNVIDKCHSKGVEVAGVTKVMCGMKEIAEALIDSNCDMIADARIQNIIKMKDNGINYPFLLLRIPMISELKKVVENVDITLISEMTTIKKLSQIAKEKDKVQKIIFMIDLGDLREGEWYTKSLEKIGEILDIENINLIGIGSNLGCFGGVLPTKEKMQMLTNIKKQIKDKYDYEIKYLSGGSTAALPLVEDDNLTEGLNHYRLGESIMCGTDVTNNRLVQGAYQDAVVLEAEIIEIKEKPSIPEGKIGLDAFGRKPQFEDKGWRKKCILAIGEQDINPGGLIPFDEKIQVLHASSDHTIIDITECEKKYEIGDILKFKLSYSSLLKSTTSDYVKKEIINKK